MSYCFDLCFVIVVFFFFKQKTAYEMRISDLSSDVCSSDLFLKCRGKRKPALRRVFFKSLDPRQEPSGMTICWRQRCALAGGTKQSPPCGGVWNPAFAGITHRPSRAKTRAAASIALSFLVNHVLSGAGGSIFFLHFPGWV